MKTVFFGTPGFAVPTLRRLIDSKHAVAAVVTQPDRRRGRGQRLSASPVRTVAESFGVRVLHPERMKDESFVSTLETIAPDVGVVAAYGKLLPDRLLALPRHGMVNVHASLLPKYRGAAPVHRAVMAGETRTGVTIIQLVKEMDAGPMLKWASQPISSDDTSETVGDRLAVLGADLLMEVLDDLETGSVDPQPQPHEEATFAPRLGRDDGVIDWGRTARDIHNQIRGLHPWPHAFSYLEGARYAILRSAVADGSHDAVSSGKPGEVVAVTKDTMVVAAGAGTALVVHELQPAGKRPLSTRTFLAGRRIRPGVVFHQQPA